MGPLKNNLHVQISQEQGGEGGVNYLKDVEMGQGEMEQEVNWDEQQQREQQERLWEEEIAEFRSRTEAALASEKWVV